MWVKAESLLFSESTGHIKTPGVFVKRTEGGRKGRWSGSQVTPTPSLHWPLPPKESTDYSLPPWDCHFGLEDCRNFIFHLNKLVALLLDMRWVIVRDAFKLQNKGKRERKNLSSGLRPDPTGLGDPGVRATVRPPAEGAWWDGICPQMLRRALTNPSEGSRN